MAKTPVVPAVPKTAAAVIIDETEYGETVASTFNVRDFAYGQAQHVIRGKEYALEAKEKIIGFPDSVSVETMAEINIGYDRSQQEARDTNKTTKYYLVEGTDTYIPIDAVDFVAGKYADKETVRLDIAYAMQFTGQAYGKLKERQPNLHGIVGGIRLACSKNRSKVWDRLTSAYNSTLEITKTSSSPKDWVVRCEAYFETLKKSRKAAMARGDTTVPAEANFVAAKKAFFEALNKD